MKRIKKMLLIVPIIFLTNIKAAPLNSSFDDDNFYNCIVVKLNTDGFNGVNDRISESYKVTSEELLSIKKLECNNQGINSVKGLSEIKNIETLNLSDNNITTIDLKSNSKLLDLLISNNKLSSIDISKNTALTNLYLNGNSLTSINLSGNKELLVVNLNNNRLTSLDLSNNSKLIDLKASQSAFQNISKVVFKGQSKDFSTVISWPKELNETMKKWQNPMWLTKNANLATVSQKGTVIATNEGRVNIESTVDGVYSIVFDTSIAGIKSDKYNIDETNEKIDLNDKNIATILKNITATNCSLMVYNLNNKYVQSGDIQNNYKLKVLNGSETLKTYTLNYVAEVANNDLESLEIKNYTIDFDASKTSYTIIVENDIEAVEVLAKAAVAGAKVEITGNEKLEVGSNTVTITITGSDKTTKTYTVNVIRKSKEGETEVSKTIIYLEELTIDNYQLNFDKNITTYKIKIADDLKKLVIKAKANDDQATIEFIGNSDLHNGSEVKVKVTALDGTSETYTIVIEKNKADISNIIVIALELLALGLLIVLCVILINKHNRKKKKEKNTSKKETKNKKIKEEVPKDENKSSAKKVDLTVSDTKVYVHHKDRTKNESYLEKTIRFRRVCPHCGTVNVLTNENCYLCGEKLDDIK